MYEVRVQEKMKVTSLNKLPFPMNKLRFTILS